VQNVRIVNALTKTCWLRPAHYPNRSYFSQLHVRSVHIIDTVRHPLSFILITQQSSFPSLPSLPISFLFPLSSFLSCFEFPSLAFGCATLYNTSFIPTLLSSCSLHSLSSHPRHVFQGFLCALCACRLRCCRSPIWWIQPTRAIFPRRLRSSPTRDDRGSGSFLDPACYLHHHLDLGQH
jgi:hypothetical protein